MGTPTAFVITHVLDSPTEIAPLQSGDEWVLIFGLGKYGLLGISSVTEYSPGPIITVVPTADPGKNAGDGLLPLI